MIDEKQEEEETEDKDGMTTDAKEDKETEEKDGEPEDHSAHALLDEHKEETPKAKDDDMHVDLEKLRVMWITRLLFQVVSTFSFSRSFRKLQVKRQTMTIWKN